MSSSADEPYEDELDKEAELIVANTSAKNLLKLSGQNRFRYSGTNERLGLLIILLLGAFLVPLAWSQAYTIVSGLLAIIVKIFVMASEMVMAILGWGLLMYPIAAVIVFSVLLKWWNRFTQANRIILQNDGLLIGWPSGLTRMLPWTEITSVFLFCPRSTMLPQKWLVGFGAAMARPLNVGLPATSMMGEALYDLLKTRCRHASVDPDLIEAWQPAIADSHTELWLKSLTKAPKEDDLMPLFPGALLKEQRYKIHNRIGVGGQGTAYLATDNESEREVVLKENLLPVYVDAEVRQLAEKRFKQEVELLSQLQHENVVRLIDSFVEEHRAYLVLDYIDGVSLRQLVKKDGALPEERVRDLASQMCRILSYLHSLEPPVVHRDFTPENLMLNKNDKLVLIDFNVARKVEATKTATVVGKHAYIPPEQFRGEADPRSDIYAFGATLHFLLTGEDPEPISQSFPKELNAELSDSMNELVGKATEQEISDRFQTASEILAKMSNDAEQLKEEK